MNQKRNVRARSVDMMFGGGKKGGGKGGMDDVLKAARRASAAKVLLEAAKPVPKKVDRLAELQKRFDALVGVHTQTEALFATGGGDLPASLPPSRMAPEAAPSLPLPPRSAGGSLCYAIGEQPGGQLERGPRLRLQPSISTPALRRHATQPWACLRAAALRLQAASLCTAACSHAHPACSHAHPACMRHAQPEY